MRLQVEGASLGQMMQQRQLQQQQMQLMQQQTQGEQIQNEQAQMKVMQQKLLMKAYQDTTDELAARGTAAPAASPAAAPAATAVTPPATAAPTGQGYLPVGEGYMPLAPSLSSAMGGPPDLPANPPSTPAAAASAPAPQAAPPPAASPQTAPDFHEGLIRNLYKNGLGFMVPGVDKQFSDMAIAHAKVLSDQAAAHQSMADQATGLLQGAASLPIEDRDAQYQRIRPQLAAIEQRMGADTSQLPQHWDATTDGTIQSLMAQAYKASDWTNHVHQAAETARLAQEGIVNNAPKAAEYLQKEMASISTPQQYTELRNRISTYAAAEQRANPNGTSYWQTALDAYPEQWNTGLAQQATLASMPAQDRVTALQKHLELTTQRLSAAAGLGPQSYATELAQTDPTEAPLFPKTAGASNMKQIRDIGLTAAQATMADFRGQEIGIQDQKIQLMRDRLDFMDAHNAQAHKDVLSAAQNKVWADVSAVMQGQGKTPAPADAIAYLRDPQRWADNPDVDNNRSELIAAFQKSNAADLSAAGSAARTARAQSGGGSALAKLQWMKDHPGQPIPAALPPASSAAAPSTPPPTAALTSPPAGPRAQPPAALPPPTARSPLPQPLQPPTAGPGPPAASPAQQAPPNKAPQQKVRVTIDGKPWDFPNQAAVDQFIQDHPEYQRK